MGIVYEARQVSLNRKVALKVLSGGLGLTGKAVTRFKREAEAAAKLHHTNIVPIYATGEEDGTHFYAMELIEGPSLDKVIKQMRREAESKVESPRSKVESREPGADGSTRAISDASETADALTVVDSARLPFEARPTTVSASDSSTSLGSGAGYFDTVARMIAEVADGLDYAHKQGVIHRDIKPSNLLLSADGRLHINDFGLARMLEEPGMTMSGEFVGSPLYMSPEQITAGRVRLDHRTDIYSLGATLYQLLTFQPPFSGESRDQILGQIISKEPKPPRAHNRKIPLDLETICLKAMEKDPDRRYQTAGALAEDLRRYVNRFEISARRAGLVQRTIKWARRRPGFAVAAGLAILLLVIAGAAAVQLKAAGERLKRIERQKAVDEAMLRNMAGDLAGAEQAIGRAELLGAPAGQTRLLRGQLALYRGLPEEAILHLKQATNQLPGNVAALGMLIKSMIEAGDWNSGESLVPQIESLKPQTSLDYLMLGSVQSHLNPAKAVANLDKGVELGSKGVELGGGPISRLLRARAMLDFIPMTTELSDARKAVADAEFANSLLSNNPLALATSVGAHLWEARLLEGKDEPGRRAALEMVRTKVAALAGFTGIKAALNARRDYYDYTGDEAAFEAELERGYRQFKTGWVWASDYATMLFGKGESRKALQIYTQAAEEYPNSSSFLGFLRPIMVADVTGDLVQAAEAWSKLPEGMGIWDGFYKHAHLFFLGSKEKAREGIKKTEESFGRIFAYREGWYEQFFKFYLEEITEEALLQKAGKSLLSLCEAHYALALIKLSDGKKAEAKQHFREVITTRVFQYGEYVWARAFLKRMEADPNWPPWIPTKNEDQK